MSEAFERVSGIVELPIFPLPLVLMPGEVLPLHIFEPRYRQMLDDLELGNNMFGVSFFDPETDFERPGVGAIGCVAEIKEVQTLEDGRSNLLTHGLIRFRIERYADVGTPYLSARIEFFEDDHGEQEQTEVIADEVYALFDRIAKAAFKMSGSRGRFPEIRKSEPEALSFLVAAAFNLDNELKYSLLSMTSTKERLERLKRILEQAVGQIEASSDIFRVAQTNGHSKKKLDL